MREFDYIIVGAGSAGCVLANRLSRDAVNQVLLLEGGGDDKHPFIHMPSGFAKLLGNPEYDWGLVSEPEPGLAGRRIPQLRGKVLGGSSSVNGMFYARGHAPDYDGWGCEGWSYSDVLPYFKRSENFADAPNDYHGKDGELNVEYAPYRIPLGELLIKAAEQAGLPFIDDYNVPEPQGIAWGQANVVNGRRCSAAVAFLKPALNRANLVVEKNATVQRIVFAGNVAEAVNYEQGGKVFSVKARREIILAAGAMSSPQLLEVSGVGGQTLLGKHGIPVVHHSPGVGANLHDHLCVTTAYRLRGIDSINEKARGLNLIKAVLQYYLTRKGVLGGTPCAIGGYARVHPQSERADIQLIVHPASTNYTPGKVTLADYPGITLGFTPCRPRSVGSIHITGPRVSDKPAFVMNYLDDPLDREVAVAGVRLCRHIAGMPALAPYVVAEVNPGDQVQGDDEILDAIAQRALSGYHPVGTCRMGADLDAVVDTRLRVRGVRNLRVADASIMPRIISGNTHAPVVMIAEKAADLILEDQGG